MSLTSHPLVLWLRYNIYQEILTRHHPLHFSYYSYHLLSRPHAPSTNHSTVHIENNQSRAPNPNHKRTNIYIWPRENNWTKYLKYFGVIKKRATNKTAPWKRKWTDFHWYAVFFGRGESIKIRTEKFFAWKRIKISTLGI